MQPEDMSNFFASVAATQDNIAREVSSASMQIDSFWREVATSSDKAREYAEARLNDFQSDPEKTAQITEFRALDNELVTAGNELQAVVDNAAQAGNADAQHVNENDGNSEKPFGSIFERLQAAFPPPDHAPGHEERQRSIHNALAEVQTALANFLLQLGVPEESFRGVLDKLFPVLERIMVLIGDLFEQYGPALLQILLFIAVLPLGGAAILRHILAVVGLGPCGPNNGSNAWAQNAFFGGAVKEGDWFAFLR